jgi:hypothetical protein
MPASADVRLDGEIERGDPGTMGEADEIDTSVNQGAERSHYEGEEDQVWLVRVAEHFRTSPGSMTSESILAPGSWYLDLIERLEREGGS